MKNDIGENAKTQQPFCAKDKLFKGKTHITMTKGRKNALSAPDKTAKTAEKHNYSGIRRAKSRRSKAETLIGKCLVHIGAAHNELYDQAVIYITDITPEKIKGIMINKLLFGTAVIECKNRESAKDGELRNVYEDLYQGGPENPASGFVLFPRENYYDADPYAEVNGDIAISTSFGVLQDILDGEGPDKKIIAMGHCAWKRGELEWQIFNNEWLIVPANAELMFETKYEDRWEKAKVFSNINLAGYIPQIGLA